MLHTRADQFAVAFSAFALIAVVKEISFIAWTSKSHLKLAQAMNARANKQTRNCGLLGTLPNVVFRPALQHCEAV